MAGDPGTTFKGAFTERSRGWLMSGGRDSLLGPGLGWRPLSFGGLPVLACFNPGNLN